MRDISQRLLQINEPFAAGLLEEPGQSVFHRIGRAYRRYYENCLMCYEEGALLFPSGMIRYGDMAFMPHYCQSFLYDHDRFEKKCEQNKCPEAARECKVYVAEHGWGGGWTHSILNYRRILREGIVRYEERVRAMDESDLRSGLLDVLEGIKCYLRRSIEFLRGAHAPAELIAALEKVPYHPAQTAYEAMVSVNFTLYLDACDNIGRVDSWLFPYWHGEDMRPVMHRMMRNLQDNCGWTIALGPDYNELTYQWLDASEGLARPLIELRVTDEMPEDLWNAAIARVLTGGGQPAFYNENAIQRRLAERIPHAPREDLKEFAGAGCTEICLMGLTYSGGTDVNLNVLLVLETCMQENLALCQTFEDFYACFTRELRKAQDDIVRTLNQIYDARAEHTFNPIRTLFIDDCIDKQIGYYQGGARYCYAVPSESGIPNTVDSLLAIRELVYEKKLYSAADFLAALEKQDPIFKKQLQKCPCYGVGDSRSDALMQDLTQGFYRYYHDIQLDIGFGILPTSHQFSRHIYEGHRVGPTPDGRASGTPVADSIAAVNGKAVEGPTCMLQSAAMYNQDMIYSIPVLNLSISKSYNPEILRGLIQGYFRLGGTQIQITCTTRKKLLAAREDPEAHRDLIVRVGGYSEYFRNLSVELQDAVIQRTMFES